MVIYLWWTVKKHCLYEDFSTPRHLVTQSSGTGDPGQGDHSGIRTRDVLIESRMLKPLGYVPSRWKLFPYKWYFSLLFSWLLFLEKIHEAFQCW